jgi:hypothetical protein
MLIATFGVRAKQGTSFISEWVFGYAGGVQNCTGGKIITMSGATAPNILTKNG